MPHRSQSRRTVAPADGERRAIGGYYPQYWLSGSIILRVLRDGRLVRLRVADPEAGRVDDLQLETPGRVDGYQVKWTEGTITFKNLLTRDGENPPLLAQLADGWKRLRRRFPTLKHAVHLCSNATPSTRDSLPTTAPHPGRRHFAAFLREVWAPMKSSPQIAPPQSGSPWGPTFAAMKRASGLGDEEFVAFLCDLELEFGATLPTRPANPTRDEAAYFGDLEHLTGALFRIVADRSRTIELDRAMLVTQLGWEARLEFKNKHELHVDMQHYEPISSTIAELERAILTLPGGYLLLVGTPGSGKSSLLTLALRQEDVRLIRYYAFIPRSTNADRGESVNFLHDVILSIEKDPQFRTGLGLIAFDRLHLLDRLRTQLALLHSNFIATGRKTVIVIDGLDHITREQNPDRSLLADLLPPNEVPDGVLFVLGSQTDAVLPTVVQITVQVPERRVAMKPLAREAVFSILNRNESTSTLTPEQKDQAYQITTGHPLALHYLLNQLEAHRSDAGAVLDSAQPYGASIVDQYRAHWPQIAHYPDLVKLLGRLARLRRPFDLSWLEQWAGEEPVNRLQAQIPHYFRRNGGRWGFFHNSFQDFLLTKTIERTPGEVDEVRGQRIHRELAEIFSREPENSSWRWEELFHRAEASDLQWFDEHPTIEEIRGQLLQFRPIEAIERDLRLALRVVAQRQNLVSLVRLTLGLKELNQREFHLENVTVIRPLLAVGEHDLAIEHIRDSDRLRVSPESALRLSRSLYQERAPEEAKILFDLAQPLELLSGERPTEAGPGEDVPEVLRQWVRTALALRQRSVAQVLESVSRLRLHNPHPMVGETDEDATEAAQAELLVTAGLELSRDRRWDEFQSVLAAFQGRRIDWSFWILNAAWKECHEAGDEVRAKSYLAEAEARLDGDSENGALLTIAKGYWRLHRDLDRVRGLFARITPPGPYTDTMGGNRFSPFLHRFEYGRLLYLLGETRNPREIVSDPDDEHHQGAVYVLRALYRLARIDAEADTGQITPWPELAHQVLPLLRLFIQSGRSWHHWYGWHAAESNRGEFYSLLIDVVARHGEGCLEGLKQAFEREWDHPDTSPGWPTDLRREVILRLHKSGIATQWAVGRLAGQEDLMLHGRDASGRTEEYQAQANAWLKLGEPLRAKQTLQGMLQVSFGVGYRKDYQFNEWIDWLGKVLHAEPVNALDRIKWFARATVSLEETTEGKAARIASSRLLTVVFRWSPRRVTPVLRWFIEHHCLWFSDALSELLEAALDAPTPPVRWISVVLRHILLPIAGQGYPDLAEGLLKASRRVGGQHLVKEVATELVTAIDLRAQPGTRYRWKQRIAEQLAIEGLSEPQVDPGPPGRDDDSGSDPSSRVLRLRGGREMLPEAVIERVNSLETFRELFTEEDSDSFFDWEPVIEKLRNHISGDDLFDVAQLITTNSRAAMYLASISEALLRHGDRDRAWLIGEKALASSTRHGWTKWYDGGSRLAAFTALRAVDPVRTKPLLYRQLAEDGGCDAESLSDVLPLLEPEAPITEVWNEVEQFCRGMFPESTLPDTAPDLPEGLADDRVELSFADLIGYFQVHPVNQFRECARRACIELIHDSDPVVCDLIGCNLVSDEAHQEQALVVLRAVQSQDPVAVRPFLSRVRDCSQSPNWLVRRLAQRLLLKAGEALPALPRRHLPPIYELSLPERPDAPHTNIPPPVPGEPILQFGSAEELIAPFGPYLELLASSAGVGFRNTAERAASLMREISPAERWSSDAERALRSELSSASLEMPFVRPHAEVARRAVFRVAAELVDAGCTGPRYLDQIEGLCAFYDELLECASPLSRNLQLVPPLSLGYLASAQDWLVIQDIDFQALQAEAPDNRIVLAQWSELKKLDWGAPSELRESTLRATSQTVAPPNNEDLYGRIFHVHLRAYPDDYELDSGEDLVVQNVVHAADTVGLRWLAFNPTLARSLGWHCSPNGLFRWVDAEGTTMVETLWWQSGNSELSSQHSNHDVGFGWVVVATRAAVELILNEVGSLVRLERITRRFREQGGRERQQIRSRARRET